MKLKIKRITVDDRELWSVEAFRDRESEPFDYIETDSKFLLVDTGRKTVFIQEDNTVRCRSAKVYNLSDHAFIITGKEREE